MTGVWVGGEEPCGGDEGVCIGGEAGWEGGDACGVGSECVAGAWAVCWLKVGS
jgi:hypothetical protein